MKVIMLEDDSVKEVKDGYARNYLLPQKLAILATPQAIKRMEKKKIEKAAQIAENEAKAKEQAAVISALSVTIKADAGEKDKLFGAIGSKEVAEALKSQHGIEVDRRKIVLTQPIKLLGEFKVQIKLFPRVSAELTVIIIRK